MLNSPNAPGAIAGQCTVSRLSIDGFEIDKTVDLSAYGDEVYDLLPIEGTSGWPVVTNATFVSSDATWRNLLNLMKQDIGALVPLGHTFIFVDQQWLSGEIPPGRTALPFLERDGRYWGLPPDDATAIRELERLRRSGVTFITFPWPTFWWFQYYSGLLAYLRSEFRCALDNERVVIFDLRR
jgi:hypothetical protein